MARYGGEEFVVVLPACDAVAGLRVAQSLRAAVEQLGIPSASPGGTPVTVSIGLACTFPVRPESWQALLGRADEACYRAKSRGRNRVVDAAEIEEPDTASKTTSARQSFVS